MTVDNDGKPRQGLRLTTLFMLILGIINLGLVLWIAFPQLHPQGVPFSNPPQSSASITSSPRPTLMNTATVAPSATRMPSLSPDVSDEEGLRIQGVMILSMMDGNYSHLFAFHPQFLPFTRLTNDTWNDITPSVSPDGSRLAFSSRRNGYWDLYLMNLLTGEIERITDTSAYDASPTWAPDNQWIAYESYQYGNLDILIRSMIDPNQAIINLTENNPSADHSPSWSPGGREIAFVSDRSGEEEIWVARLAQIDDRFSNVSRNTASKDTHPTWSPDGRYLAWTAEMSGEHSIMLWDSQNPDMEARSIGSGDAPIWSPNGEALLTIETGPNQYNLSTFQLVDEQMMFPLVKLTGAVNGMDWKAGTVPDQIMALKHPAQAEANPPELWKPLLTLNPPPPGGRFGVVPISDVTAPYPYVHDAVDESFLALRSQVAQEAGWDVLSSLENAYMALTEPPTPSMQDDWLYTGRGIALNPLPMFANWMVIVREDYEGQTYWRLYLRARYQDGSQGMPMHDHPWDLNARFTGEPRSYEAGGAPGAIPSGYWVDFSELALRFNWERLAAQINWRTFYPGIRFNLYVMREGMDWLTAMREIYPPEALATPTPTRTYTPTETDVPEDYRPRTPTVTVTPTFTPTQRDTYTPSP